MTTLPEPDQEGRRRSVRGRRLTIAAAVLIGLVVATILAGVSGVFSSGPPVDPLAALSVPARQAAFPDPPPGAVVLGAQDGLNALGLAVVPAKRTISLQASVISAQSTVGVSGLAVGFRVDTGGRLVTARGLPCGAGCYRAVVASGWPRHVVVVIAGRRPRSLSFSLPPRETIKPGSRIVARAERVWRNLASVVDEDALSDGHVTLHTTWRMVAPDKVAYTVTGGGSSVIIGDRSWTKAEGGSVWREQSQAPVQQPVPFWSKALDANILGSVSTAGGPAWKVSFFDPSTPGWYTIVVDKTTLHTVAVDMTTTAHFMHDEYSRFDAPLSIEPPAGQG
jgi:hypothetical protein